LNHEFDPENEAEGLDVILTLIGGDAKVAWKPTFGGTTHYLVAGEDEVLLV
jgi:hypothetical protein